MDIINNDKIKIKFDRVLARLGYANGKTKPDDRIIAAISEHIDLGEKLLVAKTVLSSSKIEFGHKNTVHLEPNLQIKSKNIFELLKNCSFAWGFAVTIGPYLEEKVDKYIRENNATNAVILDSIGSIAVEDLADMANNKIKEYAIQNNKNTTHRFSPGYGDFDLSSQPKFLKWLGADKIGISLTKRHQMIPQKSVTAIVGIY